MERVERALEVAKEMFVDRGYEILEVKAVGEMRRISLTYMGAPIFCSLTEEKLSVSTFKREMEDFAASKPSRVVFISSDKGVHALRERMNQYKGTKFEHFCIDDMQYNVTRHIHVPPHRRVDVPNGDFKDSQLPYMTRLDPVARYYAFEPGDLIEISRSDGTTGYRIVH